MLDTIVVVLIVALAAGYLVRRHFKSAKAGAPQCGCGCSCSGSRKSSCSSLE